MTRLTDSSPIVKKFKSNPDPSKMARSRTPMLAFLFMMNAFLMWGMGCAHQPFRPCSQAGDLTGLPLVKGDFRCNQKQLKDGSWVNHGRFVQLQPDGVTLALEGQFTEGVRTGKWIQYSEQGKPLAELYFDERGVQRIGSQPKETEPSPRLEPQTKVRE